jgi:peptide/nickel transport system ATP-binding protein/oligopeptide transport system ATP-binding protein
LLAIQGLTIAFQGEGAATTVVDTLDLALDAGRVLGLVGESGCGKSVTARSIMRLLDTPPTVYPKGAIRFAGEDLLQLDEPALRRLRGNRLAMIFQEPMTSLNPVFTVGWQLDEAMRLHTDLDADARRARAIQLFSQVGIGAAERRLGQYPQELSGGLRQRVMIAMAIACEPALLIADEPTTALDVTVQAQILDLLLQLRDTTGMAILLITHDLGVVAESCDEVAVMYAGRIVERALVEPLFASPRHPYTAGLMASIPKLSTGPGRLPTIAGTVPPPGARPTGCAFAERCPRRLDRCATDLPLLDGDVAHQAACWNPIP